MTGFPYIAVSVGNTRTQVALLRDEDLLRTERFANDEFAAIIRFILDGSKSLDADEPPAVIVASVNDDMATRIESGVRDQLGCDLYRIGEDLPVPIGTRLDPETITGVDRLLNAAAAYATLGQACIVVDAGTAVTVDFVDGEGTFHGGAIAPGARMQLAALHDQTAALPEVAFAAPNEAFGRSTAQAMLQGVYYGIRGLVWKLTERYADEYGAYPLVIATGGDATVIFEGDDLIDRIVPDLTIRGIATAVCLSLRPVDDSGDDDEQGQRRSA